MVSSFDAGTCLSQKTSSKVSVYKNGRLTLYHIEKMSKQRGKRPPVTVFIKNSENGKCLTMVFIRPHRTFQTAIEATCARKHMVEADFVFAFENGNEVGKTDTPNNFGFTGTVTILCTRKKQ